MNKKLKSEKGAITLVVLVTMLFLIAFLMTLFLRVANKAQTSAETTEQIKQKYNNLEDEETIYQSYFADEEVIPIYTVEQLKKLGSGEQVEIEQENKIYTFANDGYYILKNDLNLGGYYDQTSSEWKGIQWEVLRPDDKDSNTNNFTGTLDGIGHKITGLYIEDSSATTGKRKGLFARLYGTVKNLWITNSYIYGYSNIGAIAGINYGVIENCYNEADVVGEYAYIGGITGVNQGVCNKNYNKGNITGKYVTEETSTIVGIGGIVGRTLKSIEMCQNAGKITGKGSGIGGIAGYSDDMLIYCYNQGEVSTTRRRIGGIVGFADGDIKYCFNKGNVTAESDQVGGIAGVLEKSRNIVACHNAGEIKGNTNGGISGILGGNITNSYNNGKIIASDISGEIVGENEGTIEKCYYLDSAISPVGKENGTTDCLLKTEEQMQSLDGSFISILNFELEETAWAEDKDGTINNGYPYLIQLKSFMQK